MFLRSWLRMRQFRVRTLLSLVGLAGILAVGAKLVWSEYLDPAKYQRRFVRTIAQANRMVVRQGGFDCCGSVADQPRLLVVTDAVALDELRSLLEFAPDDTRMIPCLCCGYPGMDWYRGEELVALTALHHSMGLRWHGSPHDLVLTEQSSEKLRKWFQKRGVNSDG